jgi:hypothetical protein
MNAGSGCKSKKMPHWSMLLDFLDGVNWILPAMEHLVAQLLGTMNYLCEQLDQRIWQRNIGNT